MIRLIATDLDDTLLDARSELTPRTLAALKRAMDAGVRIALSSGRMTEAMLPFARIIGVNAPMILFNGALIRDLRDGETIFANPIPFETARRVARMVEDMGVYIQAYPGEGYFCDRRTEYTLGYEKSIRVPCAELGVPVSEWMRGDMIKMLAIDTPERIDEVQRALREAFPSGVSFMKSKAHYLEIVAEGIDKGRALDALRARLGFERDEVMAFGDGQNDAAMLAAAGWGVAVENAVDECKAVARIIAPRNTEDGVAQVIEQCLEDGRIAKGCAHGQGN